MAFWSHNLVRIVLAASVAMVVGALYFNPQINPLIKIWVKLAYPNVADPRTVVDPTLPMAGTAVCLLVAAAIMNRYVNQRQLPTWRLVMMAFELWLLTVVFQLPHALFLNENLTVFVINRIYDLLMALTLSFVLGYKRFPPAAELRGFD